MDLFSQIFKFALALGLFLVLTISHNLAQIEERYQAEFYLFLTTTTIGMMMLVSSVELLTIYVALELSSYSLYILVPLRRGDGIDVEAGIKYLFIGAVSSGFMLFGLSYIFGATGSTYLADILPQDAPAGPEPHRPDRAAPGHGGLLLQALRLPLPLLGPGRLPGRRQPGRHLHRHRLQGRGRGPAAAPGRPGRRLRL